MTIKKPCRKLTFLKSSRRGRCRKCKKTKALERHHVTYEPEKIAKLCRSCHLKITKLNTLVSQSTTPFHRLSNEERLSAWRAFLHHKAKNRSNVTTPTATCSTLELIFVGDQPAA